jgi:hypothetical protein
MLMPPITTYPGHVRTRLPPPYWRRQHAFALVLADLFASAYEGVSPTLESSIK